MTFRRGKTRTKEELRKRSGGEADIIEKDSRGNCSSGVESPTKIGGREEKQVKNQRQNLLKRKI